MNSLDYAKRTLWHYFKLLANQNGVVLDGDCKAEIEGIIEDIASWAMAEQEREAEPKPQSCRACRHALVERRPNGNVACNLTGFITLGNQGEWCERYEPIGDREPKRKDG